MFAQINAMLDENRRLLSKTVKIVMFPNLVLTGTVCIHSISKLNTYSCKQENVSAIHKFVTGNMTPHAEKNIIYNTFFVILNIIIFMKSKILCAITSSNISTVLILFNSLISIILTEPFLTSHTIRGRNPFME